MQTHPRAEPAAALAALFLACLSCVGAGVYWEDGDGNAGTIDPAGWNDIQTAIDKAGAGPDTPGTVKVSGDFLRNAGDNTVGDLKITNAAIAFSGGWDAGFSAQSAKSVLDVNGADTAGNRFRVLTISASNTVVDSLVVTDGSPSGIQGGGIYITGNDTALRDLIVTRNYCRGNWGGGIGVAAHGVRITRCDIANNQADSAGGGIGVRECGKAGSPVIIEHCDIRGNTTGSNGNGGGLWVSGYGLEFRAFCANSRVTGNRAKIGSGVFTANYIPTSSLVLFGCLVSRNYSLQTFAGGGNANGLTNYEETYDGTRFVAQFVNCTVADNTHPTEPNQYGIYVGRGSWGDGRMVFINSVTANNGRGYYDYRMASGYGLGGGHVDFLRTTVRELSYYEHDEGPSGGPPGFDESTNSLSGALSFTNPGYHSRDDTGKVTQNIELNIDGDPSFAASGADPCQLSANSNCRNTGLARQGAGFKYIDVDFNGAYGTMTDIVVEGTPPGAGSHLTYPTDLLGNPRILETGIDRGAYEYRPPDGGVLIVR